ncbi:LysR family transcriptional regulator [Bradyrhizobium erythrophlei]|uniref:LysR family transcriptional regulator n=1 Tax=Bradyrhizobium erythrophlei TaxID=1437360 RepID=UPI0035EB5D92
METSPSNVTRYVNELEGALGARLLNRSSRRLSLTKTGKTLYDRALSILDDLAETEAVASTAAIQPRDGLAT